MLRGASARPRGLPCGDPLVLAVPFTHVLACHAGTLSLVCGLAAERHGHVEKAGTCWESLSRFPAFQDNERALLPPDVEDPWVLDALEELLSITTLSLTEAPAVPPFGRRAPLSLWPPSVVGTPPLSLFSLPCLDSATLRPASPGYSQWEVMGAGH